LRDLQAHRDSAKDAIQRSLDKQAYYYDKGCCLPNLKVGDEVLLNPRSLKLMDVKGKSCKLVQQKIGPFEITEVLSPTTYRLRLPDTYPMHNVVNVQHLTKYWQNADKTRLYLSNPRDELRSSEEFEVKQIVGEQKRKGRLFYRVCWRGYDADSDTWQSARDLRNALELLKRWQIQSERQTTRTSIHNASHVMEVYLCVHHLVASHNTLSTAQSPIITMSQSKIAANQPAFDHSPSLQQSPFKEEGPAGFHPDHASIHHRVSFEEILSLPAPIHEGAISGYFDNKVT
jgi:hypothetical protein